jgi:hypothetical protein
MSPTSATPDEKDDATKRLWAAMEQFIELHGGAREGGPALEASQAAFKQDYLAQRVAQAGSGRPATFNWKHDDNLMRAWHAVRFAMEIELQTNPKAKFKSTIKKKFPEVTVLRENEDGERYQTREVLPWIIDHIDKDRPIALSSAKTALRLYYDGAKRLKNNAALRQTWERRLASSLDIARSDKLKLREKSVKNT